LVARPVAEFYGEMLSALDRLGIETQLVGKPNEVDPAIPFAEDYQHANTIPMRRGPSGSNSCRHTAS
jgi:hypothetical protein